MLNYERGSEWRRWDLHIHTPQTLKNDQYEGKTVDEKAWIIPIKRFSCLALGKNSMYLSPQ